MVRRWRKDQVNLFNGELKMSAKRKTMGCYAPKYPELDQTLLEWFSEQRSQGKFFVFNQNQLIPVISIELPCLLKPWERQLVIGQFPMLSKQWSKNIATRFFFYRNRSWRINSSVEGEGVVQRSRLYSFPGLVPELEKAPCHQLSNEDNPGPATSSRFGREDDPVPSVHDCSSAAPWLFAIKNLQYGWNPYAIWASIKQNPWIQWQQNRSSEVLWCREEELYGDTQSPPMAANYCLQWSSKV